MAMTDADRVQAGRPPATVLAIHALAWVGVAFWLVMVVSAFAAGDDHRWAVAALAVVLGGSHVAISLLASRRSPRLDWPMWLVFVGDLLLALLVNPKAWILVGATVGLLVLARLPATRRWLA